MIMLWQAGSELLRKLRTTCSEVMKELRLLVLAVLFLFMPAFAMAQFSIQSLFGHKGYEFNTIYQRSFSPVGGLSYYGFLDISASYDSMGTTQITFYHTLTYELAGNFGLAAGNTFTNDDILPHLGLYWGIENSSSDISLIPSVTYSLNTGSVGFDLDLYFEKYWGNARKWQPYTLLMLNCSLFSDDYSEMSGIGYLGVSYDKKVHFGFGSGLSTTSDDDELFNTTGLFLSYGFE